MPCALAQVMEDLRRQTPKLRSCYEKWLKANPNASGQGDLVLVVNAKGVVKRADVNETVSECARHVRVYLGDDVVGAINCSFHHIHRNTKTAKSVCVRRAYLVERNVQKISILINYRFLFLHFGCLRVSRNG